MNKNSGNHQNRASKERRGPGGRDGGRGHRRGGRNSRQRVGPTTGSSDGIPILRYGLDNNFSKFKEKLSISAIEKYGDLGRLIQTNEYYYPNEPDITEYDLEEDPHGVNLADYRDERKEYTRKLHQMQSDRPKLYAMMEGKLSAASIDELKRHKKYEEFHTSKDPLELWLAIAEIHQVASISKVDEVVKKTARDNYHNLKQGQFESIIAYKERFDAAVEAYIDQGNPAMKNKDLALDFMSGLDKHRYAEFKTEIINDIEKGAIKAPETVNAIYLIASRRLVVKKQSGTTIGVSFVTADSVVKRKQNQKQALLKS